MEKSKLILYFVTVLLSVVVGFYTLFLGRPPRRVDVPLNTEQVARISALVGRISSLEAQLTATRTQFSKPPSLPPEAMVPAELKKLQSTVDDLNGRLVKLEGAILATPAKALEIPLLQRDLENVKTSQQSMMAAVKDGVDRVYDLNKWLLGAMAVSVISLAAASFLKGKEPTKAK